MELYPAIDLRDGHCVRLLRGDFRAETVYDDDPVRVARRFEEAGVRWIHVVDLDAARTGIPENLGVIEAICGTVSCPVQAGGGVRSVKAAEALIDAGATRVVVGTAAVEDPRLVSELAAARPGRVVVGLDARDRELAVRGWALGSGSDLVEVAAGFEWAGVAALIVTEIVRDGTMEGPDLGQLTAVLEVTTIPLIASGGVGTLDDLRALAALRFGARALAGAVVGRAIYEGRFTIEEALEAVSGSREPR